MTHKVHIVRHGTRLDFLTSDWKSPFNLPKDPPLADEGHAQAQQLSKYLLNTARNVKYIFCSPFTRTVQTIEPYCRATGIKLRIEPGLAEWFNAWDKKEGDAPPPRTPTVQELSDFFPNLIDETYTPLWQHETRWETQEQIHQRLDWIMKAILTYVDQQSGDGKAEIVIVTHAACQIAAGRALLDARKAPMRCGVASVSRFRRRFTTDQPVQSDGSPNHVGKEWIMEANGEAHHLDGGLRYNWGFWGDTMIEADDKIKTRL